ncbi:MAG TPA: hypothetical protein VHA82_15080 [Ramlibacter sp.]|uniref:hypothetical protein n=1 Tax=Ramlibacter sp. TaxID=1917967 RepID=UPI002CC6E723|nr:hypothetical protein [Ramlibacter sp.]HVZ45132.1 hypothetical protein [Ramlibacter sp.]
MDTRPQPPAQAPRSAAEPVDGHRAFDFAWLIYPFVIACGAYVGWFGWPTNSRALELRAQELVSAASRGDATDAYRLLALSEGERQRRSAWWKSAAQGLGQSEVVNVRIDSSGRMATVTLRQVSTRTTHETVWRQEGGVWYVAYDGQ